MEIVEGEQVNPSQLLAQTAARVIQYLSNRKEIDQSFVKTALENKENLYKISLRPPSLKLWRGLQYRKYHGLPANALHGQMQAGGESNLFVILLV